MTSPAYHPASNGLAEHGVGIIKEALSKQGSGDVQCKLDRILFRYRNVPHTVTSSVTSGRRPRGHLDQLRPTLAGRVEGQQLSQKKYHDTHTKMKEFTPGDAVYVYQQGPGSNWIPGTVLSQDNQIVYVACDGGGTIRRHLSHVRPRYDVRIQPEQRPIIIEPVVATDPPHHDQDDKGGGVAPNNSAPDLPVSQPSQSDTATGNPEEVSLRRSSPVRKPMERMDL